MPNRACKSATNISDWLRENNGRILSLWEERIRKEVAAAQHQKTLVLRNEIGPFIDHIAQLISEEQLSSVEASEARRRIRAASKAHGGDRSGQAPYILSEAIFEYHVLREVLFQVIEEYRHPNRMERNVISSAIEEAVNDMASQFLRSLQDRQDIFLHTLVHDFRGPLNTAIMGTAVLLKQENSLPVTARSTAKRVRDSLDRLNRMVTDLLNASRAKAGGILDLEFSEVELHQLVQEVIFDTGSDRLRQVNHGGPPIVGRWNKDGLRRILENLISNALKFSFQGTPVTIVLEQSGTEALISVHNEGEPIPLAFRDRLFEQFSRAGNLSGQPGWGIGLMLVKGMVGAHHGTIEIQSDRSCGTTFLIRLPK